MEIGIEYKQRIQGNMGFIGVIKTLKQTEKQTKETSILQHTKR